VYDEAQKERGDDNDSPTKVTWKQAPIERKEILKMLQWNPYGIQRMGMG
jgi:hypothetical protein